MTPVESQLLAACKALLERYQEHSRLAGELWYQDLPDGPHKTICLINLDDLVVVQARAAIAAAENTA